MGMKILIVGGGVGGPALAGFLHGLAEVTLVDKAPAWGNIGYAISLWGNGQKILKELGVYEHVIKEGYEIPWNTFENKKGKILKILNFDVFLPFGGTTVITRSALQMALTKNIEGKVKIKMGTMLSALTQDALGVNVTFSDGSNDRFDLVVGADGIRSQVREMVFGSGHLIPFGWSVYAFWSPPNITVPKGVIEFSSSGKMCIIYPMEDKAVVMLSVAKHFEVTQGQESPKQLLRRLFADFENLIGHLIDALAEDVRIWHDELAHVDMDKWYKGKVVLLGDAQHASSPLTGMGASMALEDAYVLAAELKKESMQNVDTALARYEERRSRRIKNFRRASGTIERWIMIQSPLLVRLRDLVIKLVPTSYFVKPIEKVLAEEL